MATRAPEDAPDVAGASPPGDGVPESSPATEPPRRRASGRERSQMRRRARFLRRLRELQLRDIGGFLVECYRFGRAREELVQAKVRDALETDRELRALEGALADHRPLDEVREPGIGGSCRSCGAVHGSGDRFCSWCGQRL